MLAGYAMAGSLILGWIPLPADGAVDQVRGLRWACTEPIRDSLFLAAKA